MAYFHCNKCNKIIHQPNEKKVVFLSMCDRTNYEMGKLIKIKVNKNYGKNR